MKLARVLVSDSVTRGHPDKLCDQISDAIVDHCLSLDPLARIDVECTISTGIVFIAAHYDTHAELDFIRVTRQVIAEAGYRHGEFSAGNCTILTSLNRVPSRGRPARREEDLDDAAIERLPAQQHVTTFGYACTQTPMLMPHSIMLAHQLARRLDEVQHEGSLPGLSSDGKSQVALEYVDGHASRVHSVCLMVTGESGALTQAQLQQELLQRIVQPVFAASSLQLDAATRVVINPDGALHPGGPLLHAGLTGRKTAVDTYGEFARHSAAALSGKDPLRIDRLGAYAARHAARNVVAAGLAEQCEVQLSYSVGCSEPISVYVDTFGTGQRDDAELLGRLRSRVDLRPAGIMRRFRLREAIAASNGSFFQRLAIYGQMGRDDLALPWERNDWAAALA